MLAIEHDLLLEWQGEAGELGTSKAAPPTGEHGLAAISVVGARAFLSAWDAAACIRNLAVEPLWLAVKYRCHPLVERLLLW